MQFLYLKPKIFIEIHFSCFFEFLYLKPKIFIEIYFSCFFEFCKMLHYVKNMEILKLDANILHIEISLKICIRKLCKILHYIKNANFYISNQQFSIFSAKIFKSAIIYTYFVNFSIFWYILQNANLIILMQKCSNI